MSSQEASGHRQVRTRAKQACLHCNRRRIRCNVLQMRPCQNCLSLNVPCEIGVSKRGKYAFLILNVAVGRRLIHGIDIPVRRLPGNMPCHKRTAIRSNCRHHRGKEEAIPQRRHRVINTKKESRMFIRCQGMLPVPTRRCSLANPVHSL